MKNIIKLMKMKKPTIVLVFLIALLTTSAVYAQPASDYEMELIRHYIRGSYVEPIDLDEITGQTPEEMFSGLDDYSTYFPKEDLEMFLEDVRGEFAGIGVYITEQMGKVIIAEPIENSPAQRAGIQPGDEILSVDGEDVKGRPLDVVAAMVKGPEGTQVKIEVKRQGQEDTIIFSMDRAFITVNPVAHQVIEDIGYIEIKSFNEHMTENIEKVLMGFKEQNVDKLIIDLRNNPGGSLDEAVKLSRLLLPKGPIVHIQYRDHQTTVVSYLEEPPFENMVVLINEASASASEIFAVAAKESGIATLIGKTTFGKGSVQRVYTLPTGTGFKLTEARYLSPEENEIDNVGVAPHIEVERFVPDVLTVDFLPLKMTRKPQIGDEGSDVEGAQQRLKAMGYTIKDPQGVMGESTYQAIYQFQEDAGLYPYGILDFSTQGALDRLFNQWIQGPDQDEQLKHAVRHFSGYSMFVVK
ncbi:carboxyl-terminal protease [Alkaliphilus metalliredigens QYMF]|uniref:Carboxyl-terminal protease n=1 Tax=Alkaliphilus metalliredigens (strain QYMF) TaxID=293826 RepID=A6TJP6_ALKMQ|nr:S41 family peptidase [Alkaliphilus metalliredigens]ABR46414.1 carboxyl-terminal protease [Alkaliphilus metalliredigens QYMF]